MLYMLALNINDVMNFDFMDRPSLEVSDVIINGIIIDDVIITSCSQW